MILQTVQALQALHQKLDVADAAVIVLNEVCVERLRISVQLCLQPSLTGQWLWMMFIFYSSFVSLSPA